MDLAPGFPLAGHAGGVTLEHGDRRLFVRCSPFGQDQHGFGPILPIFPVLMRAGACLPKLQVELWVERAGEGIVVRPCDVVVERPGEEPVPPQSATIRSRVDGAVRSVAVEPRADATLRDDDVLVLAYAPANAPRPFAVVLPDSLDERRPPRIPFQSESTLVLAYSLPFLGH